MPSGPVRARSRFLPGDAERWFPPILAILVGVLLSLGLFSLVRTEENRNISGTLEEDVEDVVRTLQSHLAQNFHEIESIAAFYLAADNFDRKAFSRFTGVHLSTNPRLQALEWIPRVPESRRQEFEMAAL